MGFLSKKTCIWVIGVAIVAALSFAETRETAAVDGYEVYKSYCSPCHGDEGKGDGPVSKFIFPKPRDFSLGAYKIRSTPTGSLPTDDDIRHTINYGIPGTSMIPWDILKAEEIDALIPVLKGFSDAFQYREPEPPVEVGSEPRMTAETIAEGEKLYAEKECWRCHGEEGRGDGPSSVGLEDDWGNPIHPYDFTSGLNLKGGSSDRDIYLRFTTGMVGTPMPSFETELTDSERWYVVHYVRSLMRSASE